jgi:hypothetical protein
MISEFQKGFFFCLDSIEDWILQQKENNINKTLLQKELKDLAKFSLKLYQEKDEIYRKAKSLSLEERDNAPV